MRKLLLASTLFLVTCLSAKAAKLDVELIHTTPVETQLETPDLRDATPVWCESFDKAEKSIDLAQFYVCGKPGEPLETVIQHLREAGKRGVKIRFLMDSKGLRISEKSTIEELKKIPNLTFRLMDFSKLTGGIIHAKYFIVDTKEGYIGSQNFDWRSLKHIHETGVLIDDETIVSQMQTIFDFDWQAQQLIEAGKKVPVLNTEKVLADESQECYLVASPNAYNPSGVGDSESELPLLMAKAKKEIWAQVMTYSPTSYGRGIRPYYAVIDTAIRTAAQRGVQVHLMVADWNLKGDATSYLKSLEILPNVTVKVVSIPKAKEGFIPYARVPHTKAMSIDDKIAWVGTSNWEGGYLNTSRNLELVIQNPKFAKRVADLAKQLWNSPYAEELDINKDYPYINPGKE